MVLPNAEGIVSQFLYLPSLSKHAVKSTSMTHAATRLCNVADFVTVTSYTLWSGASRLSRLAVNA
eukprot:1387494-Amphidinium_carterae.1